MYSKAGNYIIRSLEKNKQTLIGHLPGILSSPQKKDVHKIRVAVKKINAVYGLIEFIFPADLNRKEHYEKIKNIFQNLGKLREIQLNNIYVKKFKLPQGSKKVYKMFLSTERKKATEKLEYAVKNFDNKSLEHSIGIISYLCKNLSRILLETKTKQFIREKTKRIITLIKGDSTTQKIHEIRKQMKSINYTLIFLRKVNASEKINRIRSPLVEASKIIGAWHDRIKLIHFMDKLLAENAYAKPDIIKPFRTIKNKLSHENLNTLTLLKPKLEYIILTLKSL